MLSNGNILNLSKVSLSWPGARVFLHHAWAGAENGEGIRPKAGTVNERDVYDIMHRSGVGDSILRPIQN